VSALALPPRPGARPGHGAVSVLAVSLGLLTGAVLFGLIAGEVLAGGHAAYVLALALVVVPVLVWSRPQLGPVVLITAALMVEQVRYTSRAPEFVPVTQAHPIAPIPLTSHIPLFSGIGSAHIEPADLLLLGVLIIFLARTAAIPRHWPDSHVSRAVYALLAAVGMGVVVGIMHHGTLRVALMETRPYVYLAAMFTLTAVLVRSRSAVRMVLWALVIAVGLKAVQCVYVFAQVRAMRPRPDSMIGHEVALFFAIFIFLVAALWLFDVPGALRTTATWLLPLVLLADVVNNRRTAWLLVFVGLPVLMAVAYACVPARRRMLRRIAVGVLAVAAVYFPVFWNSVGTLGQPARAIHSQVSPDARDATSDLYRVEENANLKLNIRQGGVLGKGFGVTIDYALPIVDISSIDPLIGYIPHNGFLYVPMRLGLLGAIAMWAMLGTGIVAGCRLARSRERELAVVGALSACALIAYALEGSTDQGFFFYRVAFVTGCLLGLAEAARRLARRRQPRALEEGVR
jgi:hypothetical protein